MGGANFFTRRLMRLILLAFLIACFNQLSGINAVLYFTPRIFEMTGLQSSSAMMQSVGIGLTNLVFTFIGLWLGDRIVKRNALRNAQEFLNLERAKLRRKGQKHG